MILSYVYVYTKHKDMKRALIVLGSIIILLVSSVKAEYRISSAGRQHIKKYESCSLISYRDSGGWSIGYGHHTSSVKAGQRISQKQAEKLFNEDIQKAEKMTNWLLKRLPYSYKFSQGFIDGLVSLVYNAGVGSIQRSCFYNRLMRCRVRKGVMNSDDYIYTIAAVKSTCVSSPGHKSRRAAEYKMMLEK